MSRRETGTSVGLVVTSGVGVSDGAVEIVGSKVEASSIEEEEVDKEEVEVDFIGRIWPFDDLM